MGIFMQDELAAVMGGPHEYSDAPYSIIRRYQQENAAQLQAQQQQSAAQLQTLQKLGDKIGPKREVTEPPPPRSKD